MQIKETFQVGETHKNKIRNLDIYLKTLLNYDISPFPKHVRGINSYMRTS